MDLQTRSQKKTQPQYSLFLFPHCLCPDFACYLRGWGHSYPRHNLKWKQVVCVIANCEIHKKCVDHVQPGTILLKVEEVISQALLLLYRILGLHVSYVYACL